MHADEFPAIGTSPLLLFTAHKRSDARGTDHAQIVDHAHAIFGSIAFVQVIEPGTGKSLATRAVFNCTAYNLLTVFNPTCNAVFRFKPVVTSAPGTRILFPYIGAA